MGEVAFHREKLDAAAQEYHRELELNPNSAASLARLAEIALLQGKPDDALPLFSSAIRASEYQAANALGLPRAYPAASEDLSEAEQAQLRTCLPALEGAPVSPSRSLALAVVQARLGNTDASLAAWNDFTDNAPHANPSDAYARGLDNFNRQNFEKAASDLNAWLKSHPNDGKADYLLARTYRNLSLSTLEQLLATVLRPDSYAAHELLAQTYQNAEQDAKALAEFEYDGEFVPNLPGVHFSIGHLLLKTGRKKRRWPNSKPSFA